MEKTIGLRKGGWTHEEDELLKACINKYGAGKWHLVPQRAGLNRCRKSCRLRWLNYLNPNIIRRSFAEDEVDMILRLHKLLGNRWSLIAGRLPGRTANDVKNYWHTHLSKKVALLKKNDKKKEKEKPKETPMKVPHHEVIKPQPRTFSSNSPWLKGKNNFEEKTSLVEASKEEVNIVHNMLPIGGEDCATKPCVDDDAPMWWENLLNLEDQLQVDNETIGTNSIQENLILEFAKDLSSTEDPNGSNYCWDFDLCDLQPILDI